MRRGEGVSSLEDVTEEGPADGGEETADQTGGAAGGATETVRRDPAARGYRALNPEADAAHAAKVGSLIKLQSKNKVDNSWAGVTADTIKWVFSRDTSNCGVNVINAISQAGGNFNTGTRFYRPAATDQRTANEESEEAIANIVRYWNDHVLDVAQDIPDAMESMERHNKPGHLFYGRKLAHEVIDGGSYQCPDRTNAAAVRIAQEIKPFVAFTNDVPGLDGSGYNMANSLHATPAGSRPMHFGSMNLSDRYYKQWAPYVWTQFVSGTAAARASASYVCTRLNEQNAKYSPQYKDEKRVFGLAYPNIPNGQQVAQEFLGFVEQFCGRQVISSDNIFRFSQNPSRASDEGTSMAIKFKLNGVTSLIYFLDPISPLFHINIGMKGQDYRPELIWTSTGYTDSSTVQRLYDQSWVDGNSIGVSAFGQPGGWGFEAGDAFWLYHTYHQKSPNTGKPCDPSSNEGMMHDPDYCRAPEAIVTWYYTVLPLIGGLIFAGPDLKPAHVTAGLQAYPETRYGVDGPTAKPHSALVGAGPDQYYFIKDYHEWRWRANYVSPPPEHRDGWVEFPDCQRHYLQWPDQLAIQWERGGPNHDAWCGDAKYAPPDQHSGGAVDGHEHDHAHQKDNYPRWQGW